jgi:hypothetical protein
MSFDPMTPRSRYVVDAITFGETSMEILFFDGDEYDTQAKTGVLMCKRLVLDAKAAGECEVELAGLQEAIYELIDKTLEVRRAPPERIRR